MIFIGVDPDTHDLPIAEIHDGKYGNVQRPASIQIPQGWLSIEVLRVPAKLKGDEAMVAMARLLNQSVPQMTQGEGRVLCVEHQFYAPGAKARAQDIARLSFVAGAAVASIAAEHCYTPLPQQWKGTVKKHIHQARIAQRLGWEANIDGEYAIPIKEDIRHLVERVNDWKHAFDAIGLALWAMERHELKEKIRAAGR